MLKVIAVDFDGCLCENKFPEIGRPHEKVLSRLVHEQRHGAQLILWTCRDGQRLQEAVEWCRDKGIVFDAINDNLESHKARYGNNSRKVYADEYWDDKSVIVCASESETDIAYRDGDNVYCEMCGKDADWIW